jgi:ABC-type polysaccharide/polyol phosphate transport system ATPase subunit
MAIIDVRDVGKSFRIPSVRRETVREHLFGLLRPRRFETLDVLDSVTFSVERGETVAILGRNGSGKSTLLKILCGIYRPDRGEACVRAPLTPILELGIGWNGELDAIDNTLLIGTAMGMSLREAKEAVADVLAFAGLERFARLALKHYSSGMAARLAYSVAFKAAREVLVLDEIFAVGDADFRARCEDRFRELRAGGCTTLVVSHEPRVITTFCDRALLLEEGRIRMNDRPDRVLSTYMAAMLAAPAAPAPAAEPKVAS